jgi:hypothetical protein
MPWILFLVLSFFSIKGDRPPFLGVIIWNVGQGQMVTVVEPRHCLNFDFGGENFPSYKYSLVCKNKLSRNYISHFDRDHYNFLFKVRPYTTCLALRNVPQKLKIPIPFCRDKVSKRVLFKKNKGTNSNNSGYLFALRGFYFPGDADDTFEKWPFSKSHQKKIKYLMLSHHGSNTSNSNSFIKSFESLKMAFASARMNKYGHPHWRVVKELKSLNIPLIKTETWGHIALEL